MRQAHALGILLMAALIVGGCTFRFGTGGRGGAWDVEAATFDHAPSPWIAKVATGCGYCSDRGGFRPLADRQLLVIFEDRHALLVEFNAGGGNDTALAGDIGYDRAELQDLLADVPLHPGARNISVVRVTTGRVTSSPFLAGDLRDSWTNITPHVERCDDCASSHYWLRTTHGEVWQQDVGALRDGDAFHAFADPLEAIRAALRDHGQLQGIEVPGRPMPA